MLGLCILAVIGAFLPAGNGQAMNLLDGMMNNPLAMSMLAGGSGGSSSGMDLMQMAALMNPTGSGASGSGMDLVQMAALMNPTGSGGSGIGMDLVQMAALMNPSTAQMMNPMAGIFEGTTMNDLSAMAMMDMVLGGGQPRPGTAPTRPVDKATAGGLKALMGRRKAAAGAAGVKKSKNGTLAKAPKGPKAPKAPITKTGPNIAEIMQLMQLTRGGELGGTAAMLNPTLQSSQMAELSREGVGVSPALSKMLCPPLKCQFPLPCENPITQYKPETFFVCPKCPICPHQVMAKAMGIGNPGAMLGQQALMGGAIPNMIASA